MMKIGCKTHFTMSLYKNRMPFYKKKKRANDDICTCVHLNFPTLYRLFFNSRLSSNTQRSDTYENTGLVEAEVSFI